MDEHIKLAKEILGAGMTQQGLGARLGKSQAWVGSLLAGKFQDIKWADGEALRKLHAEIFPPPIEKILTTTRAQLGIDQEGV